MTVRFLTRRYIGEYDSTLGKLNITFKKRLLFTAKFVVSRRAFANLERILDFSVPSNQNTTTHMRLVPVRRLLRSINKEGRRRGKRRNRSPRFPRNSDLGEEKRDGRARRFSYIVDKL